MNPADSLRSWLVGRELYYGWVIVALCFLMTTLTFATVYSYAVLLEPILVEFDESLANTSLVFAVQSLVTFGGAAVLGFTVDRYGIRRLLAVAGVLVGAGTVLASAAESVSTIIVGYSVIAGAGIGIVFVVAYTTPPQWFNRRRGLATGIAVSGAGVGTLSGPPAASLVIQSVGWRATYLVIGGVFVFVIALGAVFFANRPRDLDVDISHEFETVVSADASSRSRTVRHQFLETAAVVRRPLFGAIFLVLLLGFVPLYAVVVYLVEYAASVGIPRRYGVYAISAVGASNIVSKIVAGWFADAIGAVETLAGCIVLMCASTTLLVAFPTPLSIVVLAGLFGFGSGGIAALMSPLLANLFGTGDLSTLFGVASVSFAITGVTVPYLVGLSFDAFGSYRLPFLGAVVLSSLGLVVLAAIRSTVRRELVASAAA